MHGQRVLSTEAPNSDLRRHFVIAFMRCRRSVEFFNGLLDCCS